MESNYSYKYLLASIEHTKILAEAIASIIVPGDIVLLQGDLGSGKTSFTRFIIQQLLGSTIEVTSPTFNLVNIYAAEHYNIYHYDLYRLETIQDVYEIGIEDSMAEGVSFIEWPQIIRDVVPETHLLINFSFTENDQARYAELFPRGELVIRVNNLVPNLVGIKTI